MTFGNVALDRMTEADRAALLPHLKRCTLAKDEVTIEQGTEIEAVHFPQTALLTNVVMFSDGASVETALVGREGMTGLAPFMADEPCAWRVRVMIPGEAWRLPVRPLRDRIAASTDLLDLMMRLTHDYQAQASQTAACNARHMTRQRLARWLLEMSDRMGSNTLRLTQQDMADVLGMTRPSLQVEASALREAGAIDYLRAAITVDRDRLARFACECHSMDHQRSQALGLLPPRDDADAV